MYSSKQENKIPEIKSVKNEIIKNKSQEIKSIKQRKQQEDYVLYSTNQ
jgi:uncharacterized protein (DUF305 family)